MRLSCFFLIGCLWQPKYRIKTKKLVKNAEVNYVGMMFEMYGEPETSYGDITRYFTTQIILVYDKYLLLNFGFLLL